MSDACVSALGPLKDTLKDLVRPSKVAFAGSAVLLFGGQAELALVGLAASFALAKRERIKAASSAPLIAV